jgi:pre-mRNA-splicing factor 38A
MNRTVEGARHAHGVDPQHLVPKILRERIYESAFWKDHLMGFPLDSVLNKCQQLVFVGGCYANQRPTPFLCCLLKLLQLGQTGLVDPLLDSHNKYAVVLGLFLFRLTEEDHASLYMTLEPYLQTRLRLKWRRAEGTFSVMRTDEVVQALLGYFGEQIVFDVPLPRIKERWRIPGLEKRQSTITISTGNTGDNDNNNVNNISDDADDASMTKNNTSTASNGQPTQHYTVKRKKEKWRL